MDERVFCLCSHTKYDHQSRQTWDGACEKCLCGKYRVLKMVQIDWVKINTPENRLQEYYEKRAAYGSTR